MLIPYLLRLELLFVLLVVYPFEDILEPSVVLLQNSVLGGEVEWIVPLQCKLETAICELFDALVGVVHGQSNASLSFEIVNFHPFLLAAFALEDHFEGARLIYREIGGLVLIAECMPSDDNGHFPAWDESRDVFDEYGLSKDSAIEDIPDGSVRTLPHLFQIELLYSCLIGGNGGALDAYFVFLDRLSSINGNLVVCGIPMLHAQIEVFDFEVEEGQDQLVLDGLPDDPGHLVAVHLHHGVGYLYFLGVHDYYTNGMTKICDMWLLKVYVDQDFICSWACFSISWRMDWLLWCFRAG